MARKKHRRYLGGKKRGVKAGTKRGPYKKRKTSTEYELYKEEYYTRKNLGMNLSHTRIFSFNAFNKLRKHHTTEEILKANTRNGMSTVAERNAYLDKLASRFTGNVRVTRNGNDFLVITMKNGVPVVSKLSAAKAGNYLSGYIRADIEARLREGKETRKEILESWGYEE